MSAAGRIARWIWLLPAALLAVAVTLLSLRAAADDVRELVLAHALNADHPVHAGMLAFAGEVEARSKGRLRVRVHADGRLGNERELVELLQIGSIDVTKVSAGQLESFAPAFRLFGLPYVFDDSAHFWRFAESDSGRALLGIARDRRIVGLTWYDAGARSFYLSRRVDRAIRSPADLRNLSIRVMPSASAIAMVRTLGAKPVPLPFGELYTALDAGTVDGAENNPPSLYASRQYEVAGSYALNAHTMLPDVLVISAATWSQLSSQEQEWVMAAAEASSAVQRQLWGEQERVAIERMQQAGLVVIADVDQPAFREATETLRMTAAAADPTIARLLGVIDALRAPGGGAP